MYKISQFLLNDSLTRQQLLANLKTKIEKDDHCGKMAQAHILFTLASTDQLIDHTHTHTHWCVHGHSKFFSNYLVQHLKTKREQDP